MLPTKKARAISTIDKGLVDVGLACACSLRGGGSARANGVSHALGELVHEGLRVLSSFPQCASEAVAVWDVGVRTGHVVYCGDAGVPGHRAADADGDMVIEAIDGAGGGVENRWDRSTRAQAEEPDGGILARLEVR